MVLSPLESTWVVPAALAVCGLIFLGDAAAESGPRTHGIATFVLNLLSLPVGGFTLFVGALDWYSSGTLGFGPAAAMAVGAILTGRSLREVPWTGVVSLAAAAVVGWYLVTRSPWTLSLPEVLGASAVVFLCVFVVLYLIELPLRIAGLLALPRPFLVVLGVGSLAAAGYLALTPGL